MSATATGAANAGPQSTGTATPPAQPGSPSPATGPQAGGENTTPDVQKAIDAVIARERDKYRALEAKQQATEAELNKLRNTGKSAEELQKELEKAQSVLAERDKAIEAANTRYKSQLESRAKALPESVQKELTAAAGDSVDLLEKMLPIFEKMAATQQRQPTPGGTVGGVASVDTSRFKDLLNAVPYNHAAIEKFYAENGGKAAVHKALSHSKG